MAACCGAQRGVEVPSGGGTDPLQRLGPRGAAGAWFFEAPPGRSLLEVPNFTCARAAASAFIKLWILWELG